MISLFSNVFDKGKFQRDFNNDLSIIREWAFKQKMQFNSDPNKQTNEIQFLSRPNIDDYIHIKLNDTPVQLCESLKQLVAILDKHLNFHKYIEKKLKFVTN